MNLKPKRLQKSCEGRVYAYRKVLNSWQQMQQNTKTSHFHEMHLWGDSSRLKIADDRRFNEKRGGEIENVLWFLFCFCRSDATLALWTHKQYRVCVCVCVCVCGSLASDRSDDLEGKPNRQGWHLLHMRGVMPQTPPPEEQNISRQNLPSHHKPHAHAHTVWKLHRPWLPKCPPGFSCPSVVTEWPFGPRQPEQNPAETNTQAQEKLRRNLSPPSWKAAWVLFV